jgi:hypothetical protein
MKSYGRREFLAAIGMGAAAAVVSLKALAQKVCPAGTRLYVQNWGLRRRAAVVPPDLIAQKVYLEEARIHIQNWELIRRRQQFVTHSFKGQIYISNQLEVYDAITDTVAPDKADGRPE